MAKAFYDSLTGTSDAEAAGTHVIEHGQTLSERKRVSKSKNFYVIDVMKEVNLDISNYVRKPLSKTLAANYDVIVSMVEEKDAPSWLPQAPGYIRWHIHDPRGQNLEKTALVRDEIKSKVAELINN